VNAKKALIAVAATMGLLFGAGVAYANSSPGDEEGDGSYKGSIAAPDQSGASLRELANIDQAAAEKAALEAVPGRVLETELEAEGYVVYDVEVAGEDGKTHDLEVDAGNGEILDQGLEEDVDEADGPTDTEDADESGETEDAD
jgi:Peptidase propeptide and YPEB domain